MKNILLFVMIFFATAANAQRAYITTSGDTLKIGDTVYVGKGSMPDGKYKYIDGMFGPGEGQRLTVNKFLKEKNTIIVRLHLGGIAYLRTAIDYALDSKEILLKPIPSGTLMLH